MITNFRDEHAFLSNFYPAPVLFEGHIFPSVEHAYQAAKAHPACRGPFTIGTAAQAKKKGRAVDPYPTDWDQRKVDVMRQCLAEKFAAGTPLAAKLMATGDQPLVEGNWWGDTFWGVCRGRGQNMLGALLMERRDFLRKAADAR